MKDSTAQDRLEYLTDLYNDVNRDLDIFPILPLEQGDPDAGVARILETVRMNEHELAGQIEQCIWLWFACGSDPAAALVAITEACAAGVKLSKIGGAA